MISSGITTKVTGPGVDTDERSENAALIWLPCTDLFGCRLKRPNVRPPLTVCPRCYWNTIRKSKRSIPSGRKRQFGRWLPSASFPSRVSTVRIDRARETARRSCQQIVRPGDRLGVAPPFSLPGIHHERLRNRHRASAAKKPPAVLVACTPLLAGQRRVRR